MTPQNPHNPVSLVLPVPVLGFLISTEARDATQS